MRRAFLLLPLLAASPQLAFTEMRETLGMTDGNLTTHLRTLHEAGYTSVTKAFQGGGGWCVAVGHPQCFPDLREGKLGRGREQGHDRETHLLVNHAVQLEEWFRVHAAGFCFSEKKR